MTFIVFTSNDKEGVIDPEVVGPFSNAEEAETFLREHDERYIGSGAREPIDGGYAGAVIAASEVATSPAEKIREWEEMYG